MWLQSFDDVHSDEKPGGTPPDEYIVLLAKLTRILEDPRTPMLLDNPWAQALRESAFAVAEHATAVQVDRWVQANVEYFRRLPVGGGQPSGEPGARAERLRRHVAEAVRCLPVHRVHRYRVRYEVPAPEWSDPACARCARWSLRSSLGQ